MEGQTMKYSNSFIKYLCIIPAAAVVFFSSCPSGMEGAEGLEEGNAPPEMVGTWYSDYNLTRAVIGEDGTYSFSYDEVKRFKGVIKVNHEDNTIHYTEPYTWENGEWTPWGDDFSHLRVNYVISSDGYFFTDAFEMDMKVYKRTAGTSGSLFGTWEYEWKEWYDFGSEDDPVIHRKTVLQLNSDYSYSRTTYHAGVEETKSGTFTYGDINSEELFLSESANYSRVWVVNSDYLVIGPRYIEQDELALIEE